MLPGISSHQHHSPAGRPPFWHRKAAEAILGHIFGGSPDQALDGRQLADLVAAQLPGLVVAEKLGDVHMGPAQKRSPWVDPAPAGPLVLPPRLGY